MPDRISWSNDFFMVYWFPQPDITAYELAVAMNILVLSKERHPADIEKLVHLHKVSRHFIMEEMLRRVDGDAR